jgi:hypothetical protein
MTFSGHWAATLRLVVTSWPSAGKITRNFRVITLNRCRIHDFPPRLLVTAHLLRGRTRQAFVEPCLGSRNVGHLDSDQWSKQEN